jgi:hypothetical protein
LLTVLSLTPVYWMRDDHFAWISAFPALAIFVMGAMLFRLLTVQDFHRLLKAIRRKRGE